MRNTALPVIMAKRLGVKRKDTKQSLLPGDEFKAYSFSRERYITLYAWSNSWKSENSELRVEGYPSKANPIIISCTFNNINKRWETNQ